MTAPRRPWSRVRSRPGLQVRTHPPCAHGVPWPEVCVRCADVARVLVEAAVRRVARPVVPGRAEDVPHE